jgi:hypothetical protein
MSEQLDDLEQVDFAHDDFTPVKVSHMARELTDEELGGMIHYAKWTPETYAKLVDAVLKFSRYNHAYREIPAEIFMESVIATEPCTFFLGDDGFASLSPCVPGHSAVAQIFLTGPAFMSRPRVWRGLLRHAFRRWKLRHIYTLIAPTNKLSLRLAEKVGFKLEGRLRQELMTDEGVQDALVYGILPKDVGL